jgi:hypothetical protein
LSPLRHELLIKLAIHAECAAQYCGVDLAKGSP